MNEVEAALEVHRDRAVKLRLADLEDRFRVRRARIVQEYVEMSPFRVDLFDDRMRAGKIAYIGLKGQRALAARLDIARGCCHLLLQEIDESDVEAGIGKRQRTGAADAARAAGDEGRLCHGSGLRRRGRARSGPRRHGLRTRRRPSPWPGQSAPR